MTIILRHEVKCDKCGTRQFCIDSYEADKTTAIKSASTFGWIRKLSGGKMSDFCPDCQKSGRLFRAG